jgi:hypothetical protein
MIADGRLRNLVISGIPVNIRAPICTFKRSHPPMHTYRIERSRGDYNDKVNIALKWARPPATAAIPQADKHRGLIATIFLPTDNVAISSSRMAKDLPRAI